MARFRLIKRLLRLVLALLVVIMLGFGALVIWVATGPRSLDAFVPYIERAIASESPHYRLTVKNALLVWEGWTHPLNIRVLNVSVTDAHAVMLARLPEVGVRLYILDLLRGDVKLKAIELLSPTVDLVQDAKGRITNFGLSDSQKTSEASIASVLGFMVSDDAAGPLGRLKSFAIRRANLSIRNSQGTAFLSSQEGFIEIKRKPGYADGKLEMPLQIDGKTSHLAVQFVLSGADQSVRSHIVFDKVPFSAMQALAPSQPWIGGLHMPLSGHVESISDFEANTESLAFKLNAGPGTVDLPEQLERPMTVEHVLLKGELRDKLTRFIVKQALMDFGSVKLDFRGEGLRTGDDYGVEGRLRSANVPVDDLHLYWPLKLAPHSRHWVMTHISKGIIEDAQANLHFKPGEFKLKNTPDAAIETLITVKGATVAYKPTHPPITDINGAIRFTGRTMDARVTGARYLSDTRIRAGRVRFPDFYPDDVRLFAELRLDASTRDIRQFLALPDLDKAGKLHLTDAIAGTATGDAKLDFIAFSENGKDDIGETGKLNYTVNASLTGASQPQFLNKYDVADANVSLAVDNQKIEVEGNAKLNGLFMQIALKSAFADKHATDYRIQTVMPIDRLPDFDLPKLDFAGGTMKVDARFSSMGEDEKTSADLDLTETSIALVKQGLLKKAGERAALKISTQTLASGNTFIPSFTYRSDTSNAAGTAEFDEKLHDFSRFSLAPVKLAKTDLDRLDFVQDGDRTQLKAQGRVFDVSAYIDDHSSHADLDYGIDIKVQKLLLGEGRAFSNADLVADCPAAACRSVNMHAILNGGAVFDYRIEDGRLSSRTSNAGELARVLGIFSTIEGGEMTLSGRYEQDKLRGTLEARGYRLKHAPVMAKIFTLASLSGMLNTLMGKGIYFERLTAPFQYKHGIVILKDAKAHGAALGFTADGVIDTDKSTLDLKGLLVPSYTLNSLLGNIPLLGDMLMGGPGKGLLALSYGIHGRMQDPTVRVNPLSVLTPGFTRDVFTVFDKPAPDLDKLLARQKRIKRDSSAD